MAAHLVTAERSDGGCACLLEADVVSAWSVGFVCDACGVAVGDRCAARALKSAVAGPLVGSGRSGHPPDGAAEETRLKLSDALIVRAPSTPLNVAADDCDDELFLTAIAAPGPLLSSSPLLSLSSEATESPGGSFSSLSSPAVLMYVFVCAHSCVCVYSKPVQTL